jgi:hypothetical protein
MSFIQMKAHQKQKHAYFLMKSSFFYAFKVDFFLIYRICNKSYFLISFFLLTLHRCIYKIDKHFAPLKQFEILSIELIKCTTVLEWPNHELWFQTPVCAHNVSGDICAQQSMPQKTIFCCHVSFIWFSNNYDNLMKIQHQSIYMHT